MADARIDSIRIAVPCPALWEGMAGDERVRHCTLCNLNVYNFAEMTRGEVGELLLRTEGRVCARLYRRGDGTVITRDCPTGLRAVRQRAVRVAAAVLTALLSIPAFAFGGAASKKPRLNKDWAKIQLTIKQVAASRPAVLTGVALLDGNALPGVTITVQDESTQQQIAVVTDMNGAFKIASLSDGLYRVDVTMESMKPGRVEHLQLKAGDVAHASVAMQLQAVGEAIVVGAIAAPLSIEQTGISTTFTQDFINKLPI
jgi:hypothetical protein